MKRIITSGVRPKDGSFVMDYQIDLPSDIIDIVPPQLYRSVHKNRIFWFGYKFKDDVSKKLRSEFIHYIKGLSEEKPSENELDQFICLPLVELDKQINLQHIDCMVYPISDRSPLVRQMIRSINSCTSHRMRRINFEILKQCPTDISFDWEQFESDYEDSPGYLQMVQYIENILLPKIHKLDYFSIARNVKPKYRPYIQNFLKFADEHQADKFSAISNNQSILVVDDINTSGSTLNEILRILTDINNQCNIFIYTLIGN